MHQALEHHRAVVDVVVDREIHPAQPAVRDAALDFVLAGDGIARIQLRQKRIRTSAERAGALRGALTLGAGPPAHRFTAVPAEPLGLRHHGIGHQGFERVDITHPGDLDQPAAELPDRWKHPCREGPFLRLGIDGAQRDMRQVVVIVEIGAEQRLRGV